MTDAPAVPPPFVPDTAFAVPGRIVPSNRAAARWQPARIAAIRRETPRATTFRLALSHWTPHAPGQHYMVRLTAPDGYTATRHYSVASPPEDEGFIELTVGHVAGGEVSGHLHTTARPGDTVEVRGPLGGFFAWPGDRPALLLGAGTGVVPLMAMVRHHRRRGLSVPLRLIVSARTREDLLYADEYGAETTAVLTRTAGRLSAAHVSPYLRGGEQAADWEAYVCGGNGFAEHASRILVDGGQPVNRIRIERFG
ncbi:ferredoxin reductase [Streptomyces sp. NPDC021225]|uniref:ferredoxin reductase n=1 Tax=Streptomyces sp. NPDC021225 TaxID=3365121 RepID=UPI0037A7DD93